MPDERISYTAIHDRLREIYAEIFARDYIPFFKIAYLLRHPLNIFYCFIVVF